MHHHFSQRRTVALANTSQDMKKMAALFSICRKQMYNAAKVEETSIGLKLPHINYQIQISHVQQMLLDKKGYRAEVMEFGRKGTRGLSLLS